MLAFESIIDLTRPMSVATWKDFVRIIESNHRIAHTYETLVSGIHFAAKTALPGAPLKSLMICSAQPGEGKTTVSVGLTLTMALAGRRVLLVDADARRPAVHEIFELSSKPGFTDVLAEASDVKLNDVVQHVALDRPNASVDIVPSGPPLPAHANPLASSRLAPFIAAASEQYHLVVFDSPPVLAVSDSCFLAPVVSGVIFVVGTGSVQERDAKLAKDRIQKAGGRLLGFVMNRFDDPHSPGYHPYEGYYDFSRT